MLKRISLVTLSAVLFLFLAGLCLSGPLMAAEPVKELIRNGTLKSLTGWSIQAWMNPTNLRGEVTQERDGIKFRNTSANSRQGLIQTLDVDVSGARALILRAVVKADLQTLNGTGWQGREAPVAVMVTYTDVQGVKRVGLGSMANPVEPQANRMFWHGFYYINPTGNSRNWNGTKVNKSQWYTYQIDLMTLNPKPRIIHAVGAEGSGWPTREGKINFISLMQYGPTSVLPPLPPPPAGMTNFALAGNGGVVVSGFTGWGTPRTLVNDGQKGPDDPNPYSTAKDNIAAYSVGAEPFQVNFRQSSEIHRVGIMHKYGGGAGGRDIIRQARLTFSDGTAQQITFNQTYGLQYLDITPKVTQSIRVEPLNFYPGSDRRWGLIEFEAWGNASVAPPPINEVGVVIFDDGNIQAVYNNPTRPATFTISVPHKITYLQNYHWNNAHGATPGQISFRHNDGRVFGPWQTAGYPGQGGVPNAYWRVAPNVEIPAGTYTINDSQPSTWSQNAGSQYRGMSRVMGQPMGTPPPPINEVGVVIFDDGNIAAVYNNPTRPATFTITVPHKITYLQNYHWNNARGATPGQISFRHNNGRVFGPWQTAGYPGQGGVPNAYWRVAPNVEIPAGTYTINDSQPSTWSQNAGSQNRGMSRVMGQPMALNLSGPWNCDDGGRYYIRQLGAKVWWFGERTPTNPSWSNVAHGDLVGNELRLDWADVPKGSIMQSGILVLDVTANRMTAKQKTGGFGGSVWTR
jgi:hypothetical protein